MRRKKMTDELELEPIEVKEAKEALKLLLSEGKALWKNMDDFGELLHWLRISFTGLEPLPDYQERFRLLCENRRRPPDERLSAGIHVLDCALKQMDDANQINLENPSLSYRRLIGSLPD
jgi:hypothetical protein